MGRILGIDYGSKRVGLAVTDDLRMIASPLDVYHNDAGLMKKLMKLCSEYSVDLVVLGLPLSDKYKEAEFQVRSFGERLTESLGLKVEYQDETLSSLNAENFLRSTGARSRKMKEQLDKYAAQRILEDYLNSGEK